MGKYEALGQFLAASDTEELPLRFSDLERMLGAPLPASAFQYREWWANQNRSQSKSWMDAGWQVWSVDLGGEKVVFRRTGRPRRQGRPVSGPVSPPSAEGVVALDIDQLSTAARKLIEEHIAQHGGDESAAVVGLLNAAGAERLEKMFRWFSENGGKFDHQSSADLIREDRDAR